MQRWQGCTPNSVSFQASRESFHFMRRQTCSRIVAVGISTLMILNTRICIFTGRPTPPTSCGGGTMESILDPWLRMWARSLDTSLKLYPRGCAVMATSMASNPATRAFAILQWRQPASLRGQRVWAPVCGALHRLKIITTHALPDYKERERESTRLTMHGDCSPGRIARQAHRHHWTALRSLSDSFNLPGQPAASTGRWPSRPGSCCATKI